MPTNRHSKLPRPMNTLSPKQTSKLTGMSPNILARWARLGKLEVVKVGRLNRYVPEQIRSMVIADNPKNVAERLLEMLESMVTANNAEIAKEARSGKRKD